MSYTIAGIDIHKKVVMVVATDVAVEGEWVFQSARFGTTAGERQRLVAWLQEGRVQEVVMESTAQYWKPVWLELEPHRARLHLAQAHSNRAPQGRKHDFGDAQRLLRRLVAGELLLSFVPDAEQRQWRMLTRGKLQVVRDRVRLHNQLEALLEEMRIKLSSVISDLLSQSGRRILQALAQGIRDPLQLAALGDDRLKCSKEELIDALRGQCEPIHGQLLMLFLERLAVLDRHLQHFDELIAEALKGHAEAVIRLAEIPGFGPDSAQQLIAEIGPEVKAFPSAGEFASWIGICPGSDESAEQNHSSHSPKGNPFVRRLFTQAAQAAVKKKGSHFQSAFRHWLPKLHYQGAIWAVGHKLARVVWKILHDRVHYIEQGEETNPQAKKRRAQKMVHALRRMGYQVEISSLGPLPAPL